MKNRNAHAFATQLLLASVVVLGTGGSLGFAIVDLRQEISISANTTRLLDQTILATTRRIAEISGDVAGCQSPEALDESNRTLALGLIPPSESQVVRVNTSVTNRLAALRNAEIFAAESGQIPPVRFNLGDATRK